MSAEPAPPDEQELDLLDVELPAEEHAPTMGDPAPPAPGPRRPRAARVEAGPGLDPDAPDAEKEPSPPRKVGFEDADAFLARLDAAGNVEWVVKDLIPEDGIAVWHGRPRSMKSLAALALALAAACDHLAFGEDRFATMMHGGSVLYLTEEDGERLIALRLRLMVAGKNLAAPPKRLKILARPGWNLEQPSDQAAILASVREASPAAALLIIDPARGSMPGLDKGPADASAAIRFLRYVLRETAVRAILILHHDVKPPREGRDERSRAERASGGAVFSIADCPVNFERVSDRAAFAVPTTYKVGADPQPFRIEFESGSPAGEPFRGFLRASIVSTNEQDETDRRAELRVQEVLDAATDWLGRDAIFEAVGGRRQVVLDALKRLTDSGQATVRTGGRGGRAKEWRKGLGQ